MDGEICVLWDLRFWPAGSANLATVGPALCFIFLYACVLGRKGIYFLSSVWPSDSGRWKLFSSVVSGLWFWKEEAVKAPRCRLLISLCVWGFVSIWIGCDFTLVSGFLCLLALVCWMSSRIDRWSSLTMTTKRWRKRDGGSGCS